MPSVAKFNGVAIASVAKFNNVAIANISKINTADVSLLTYEDFTSAAYFETDPNNDITRAASIITTDTMNGQVISTVRRDLDPYKQLLGDYKIYFEAEITATDADNAEMVLCAVTTQNVANASTRTDMESQFNEGHCVRAYRSGGNIIIGLHDYETDSSDTYEPAGGSTLGLLYYALERIGSTTTLKIYSNAARTSLVDTLTITSDIGGKYKLVPTASADVPSNVSLISGYVQNMAIVSYTQGYQDLTAYAINGTGSFTFPVSDIFCTFTDMQVGHDRRISKDFGANYFTDFEIQFEVEITATQDNSPIDICTFCDAASDVNARETSNDGLSIRFTKNSVTGYLEVRLRDLEGSATLDSYLPAVTTLPLYYYTFTRVSDALTLTIYSDAERTSVVDTLTGTATNTEPYQYLLPICGNGSAGTNTISGRAGNFRIISVG